MNAQQTFMWSISIVAPILSAFTLFFVTEQTSGADSFVAVDNAMQECIAKQEVAGVVTLIATRDKVLDVQAAGLADIATESPMRTGAICWIASMTKPITATAVLMLQEEGRLLVCIVKFDRTSDHRLEWLGKTVQAA
jgi:CubicO group peptidase (beta-lactamase class C family)